MTLISDIADASHPDRCIEGVELRPVLTHADQRGFFRELIRSDDPFFAEGFGQWSHSLMQRHTLKAWHFHHRQVDWWYAPVGSIEVALYDDRAESPTHGRLLRFRLGDSHVEGGGSSASPAAPPLTAVVRIPPGVVHGCRVDSATAHLFYITSRAYDPHDEGRYPYDSGRVPFRWPEPDLAAGEQWIISERDRKLFVPPHPRDQSNG